MFLSCLGLYDEKKNRIDAKLITAALTKTGCSGSQESLNFTNNLMREHAQRLQFTRLPK